MSDLQYKRYPVDRNMLKELEPITYTEIFERNDYDLVESEVYGSTVIDIGANLGMFSLLCAEMGAKQIVAVEAQPTIYATGLLNFVAGRDTIKPFNYAVMDCCDKIVYIPNNHVGSKVSNSGDPVKTTTLQKLLNDNFIRDTDIILKLDCEGSEFNIIMTATRAFLRRFKTIHIELHGETNDNVEWHDVSVIRNRLIEYGFRLVKSTAQAMMPEKLFVEKWVRI